MSSWILNQLQNQWVVGIGAGIVSSLAVFFLTKIFFDGQNKRDLDRKVGLANSEIVLAVRHGIPENTTPTFPVLKALISATARKHGLSVSDVYGHQEVSEDLIKEVMDSSFISADTKTAYCARLVELISNKDMLAEKYILEKSSDNSNFFSGALSVVAGLFAASVATSGAIQDIGFSGRFVEIEGILTASIFATFIVFLAILVTYLFFRLFISKPSAESIEFQAVESPRTVNPWGNKPPESTDIELQNTDK